MKLRTEVGLSPGYSVLDGDPAPLPKGAQPPIFGPCLLWPNGRLSQLLLSTCNTRFLDFLAPTMHKLKFATAIIIVAHIMCSAVYLLTLTDHVSWFRCLTR